MRHLGHGNFRLIQMNLVYWRKMPDTLIPAYKELLLRGEAMLESVNIVQT